jgi:REP element-mobilizing transposase RayT
MQRTKFHGRPLRLERIFQRKANPVYFVTLCTHLRRPWLACVDVHALFIRFSRRANADFNIAVGRYVIMPDHLHLFVSGDPDFIPGRWVGMLKQVLARARPPEDKVSCGSPHENPRLWQEGFFDHLLRSDESMAQKWEYVRQNPVRAKLAVHPEDWPYQGEIILIDGC